MIWAIVPSAVTLVALAPAPPPFRNAILGNLAWRVAGTGVAVAAWAVFFLARWVGP